MQGKKKSKYYLMVRSSTWNKDSHSLFDYESNKTNTMNFYFPIGQQNKPLNLYRKRQSSSVIASDSVQKVDPEEYQFLTQFEIKFNTEANKIKLEFTNDSEKTKTKKKSGSSNNNEKLNTEESISSASTRQEETYLIVRKLAELSNSIDDCKGYQLQVGQFIRLGRVEYYVSEVCIDNIKKIADPNPKSRKYFSNNILKHCRDQDCQDTDNEDKPKEKNACKICLDDTDKYDNFLFRPCKCAGSCGTVHLECLIEWIKIKVKKDVVGGTVHYNFEKFQCEVCKTELPMIIDVDGEQCELLPIKKPKENYMILEAACEKSKSIMMIQNVPSQGIKLGRGHECEIRITDISVSRNHALIKFIGNNFMIFDNKSKFGTLIREENIAIEVGKNCRGVQIGRSILNFQLKKKEELGNESSS